MTLRQIIRSNYVTRWHSNPSVPAEPLGQHHAAVAQIILHFWPDASGELIRAALHHDCGELMVGDVSGPAKDANHGLAELLDEAEFYARRDMGIPEWDLNKTQWAQLKFADRAAAYFHVRQTVPHVLEGDGWPEAIAWLEGQSWALGICAEWVGA